MNICDICSQLNLTPGLYDIQHLGPWERLAEKSQSIKPSEGGCAGCAFFVDIIRNSDNWAPRLSELEGKVVNFSSLSLDVTTPDTRNRSGFGVHDMRFDLCTTEDVSGMFNAWLFAKYTPDDMTQIRIQISIAGGLSLLIRLILDVFSLFGRG